jgi:nucleoside-diphosphate-sugar epimerase
LPNPDEMASPAIKNIALVGASGNLGSLVLKNLVQSRKPFSITVLSRSGSKSAFPADPSITVKTGSYESASFLESAFAGIDAVILTLNHSAVPDAEIRLIEAAAAAGVKWIFPTEFGSDTGNEVMINAVPIHPIKVRVRGVIEDLAKKHEGLKWIGLVTNPWFDFVSYRHFLTNSLIDTDFVQSLNTGLFGIVPGKREAHLLGDGTAKFNTTNLSTAALSLVRLAELPIASSSGPSLSDFANRLVYVRSFRTCQREILDTVQRVTGTTDSDWAITASDQKSYMAEGAAKLAKGDFYGMANMLYGAVMGGGMGGDYESDRGVSNAVLGLPQEDLDSAVREALKE